MTYSVNPEMADKQLDFISDKGRTAAVLAVKNITEVTVSKQDQELWLIFINDSKAFTPNYGKVYSN